MGYRLDVAVILRTSRKELECQNILLFGDVNGQACEGFPVFRRFGLSNLIDNNGDIVI
jgi:hypothetical protein